MKTSDLTKGKSQEEKYSLLDSIQYYTLLKQKEGKFYLIIPELSLVAVSDNLVDAYTDLHKQKQDLINRILDCEAEDELRLPRKHFESHDTLYQLKIFTYKLLIVCTLGGLTFTLSSALIADKLANISVARIVKTAVKDLAGAVEGIIVNMPEELKQERLHSIHRIIENLRPLALEFRSLFTPLPHGNGDKIESDSSSQVIGERSMVH